jgi:hypothetical protein
MIAQPFSFCLQKAVTQKSVPKTSEVALHKAVFTGYPEWSRGPIVRRCRVIFQIPQPAQFSRKRKHAPSAQNKS